MINRVDRLINQREDKVKIGEVNLENDKIIHLYKGKVSNLFYVRLPIEKEVIRQVSVNLFMKFLAKKISFQEMMSIAEGTTIKDIAEFSGFDKISHDYVGGDVIVNGDELVKFSFEAPSYENIDTYKSNITKTDLGS